MTYSKRTAKSRQTVKRFQVDICKRQMITIEKASVLASIARPTSSMITQRVNLRVSITAVRIVRKMPMRTHHLLRAVQSIPRLC